jgi:hypothetical protein
MGSSFRRKKNGREKKVNLFPSGRDMIINSGAKEINFVAEEGFIRPKPCYFSN